MVVKSVNVTTVEKWLIKADGLDPISLYVEDKSPSQAKITIEVFGDAWSYYWGAMGDRGWKDFILSADNEYLVRKFIPMDRRTETDLERIKREADLPSWIEHINDIRLVEDRMVDHYGDDWYMGLPTRNTSETNNLYRILDAIKESLALQRQADVV